MNIAKQNYDYEQAIKEINETLELTMKISKEIARQEKILVAYHEAGHERILSYFGGNGDAKIWENTSESASLGEEKAWLGHVKVYAEIGSLTKIGDHLFAEPTKNAIILVGLAGLVSEEIYKNKRNEFTCNFEHDLFETINELITLGEVSETDLEMIGTEFCLEDVKQCLDLLVKFWDDVVKKAEWLIETS